MSLRMQGFLTSQLDYIYFTGGLVLVLLGAVTVTMTREGPLPIPWRLLAASVFALAAAQWLHLLSLSVVDDLPVRISRTVMMGLGYIALLEFARRSQAVLRGSAPRAWIHVIPLAIATGLTTAMGLERISIAVRLGIGMPAALWVGMNFLIAAAREPDSGIARAQHRALSVIGYGFAGLGVLLGLEATDSPYLPGARVIVTGVLSLAAWAYAASLDPSGRLLRKRWRTF